MSKRRPPPEPPPSPFPAPEPDDDANPDPSDERLQERTDERPLWVNIHGVKVPMASGGAGIPQPKSWREVGSIVNRRLMKLAVSPFAVATAAADVVVRGINGVGRAITGTSKLPGALANRVAGTIKEADANEASAQAKLLDDVKQAQESGKVHPVLEGRVNEAEAMLALKEIQQIRDELRPKGFTLRIVHLGNGIYLFILTRPDDANYAQEMGRYRINEALDPALEQDEPDPTLPPPPELPKLPQPDKPKKTPPKGPAKPKAKNDPPEEDAGGNPKKKPTKPKKPKD